MTHLPEPSPERVLVLTPTGGDAVMVEARLVAAGFTCAICTDLDSLVSASKSDAGVALIAQEALGPGQAETLLAALDAQPPWSDLPVVLLTPQPTKRVMRADPTVAILERANVLLLQRPMHPHLLVSAVRSAVRARRRQYEMRDLHRQLERAVQLSEVFVGIVGHDLRTPLGAIKMASDILVKSAESPLSQRVAEKIAISTQRMGRMIEQLLDFARVRQGRGIPTHVVPTDLGEVARPVLQELADASPKTRLDVSTFGDLRGRWDPDRLAQLVSNLVGNAIQHGLPHGGVTVALDGTRPQTVRFVVCNAGEIPDEALPTLFEPFKSGSTSRTGLGLGLFIASEIVRAHGGTLTVRVTDGSTFFETTLPREAQPLEPSSSPRA